MPIAAVVDTIESVPEALRTEYTKADDGKFYLNLDGGDALPFVKGLKTALDTERGTNRATKDKIAAWERLGVSPDEIQERLDKERKKAEELEIKAGNFDGVLAKKLGDQKLEYDGKITTAEKQRVNALNVASNAIIRSDLGSALVKFNATAEGMKALPKLIGDRVKIDFDEEGSVSWKILDRDGKPMVGSRTDGLADYDDLVKDAMKEYASLFEGKGGGSGGPRKPGGGGDDLQMTKADFDTLTPKERAAKMAKPGFKLVG